jgi:hypothetical protein
MNAAAAISSTRVLSTPPPRTTQVRSRNNPSHAEVLAAQQPFSSFFSDASDPRPSRNVAASAILDTIRQTPLEVGRWRLTPGLTALGCSA